MKVPKRGLTNEKLISEQHNTFFTFTFYKPQAKRMFLSGLSGPGF